MKTVVSKTGIEVLYPCTIHLLNNCDVIECEFKSDNIGQDLIDYICEYINLKDAAYWGLKFVDMYEQRHWLVADKLIRTQVMNSCPVNFKFRVKVYPPEPYKILDKVVKDQIFMQLRFDLVSGRLGCGASDGPLLVGLILQYIYGNYDSNVHVGNYIRNKIIIDQNFSTEMKAIDMHKNHLQDLSKEQTVDLFLRLACQLETYGVEPYLVEDETNKKIILWFNHKGMTTFKEVKYVDNFDWMAINKISHEEKKLYIHLANDATITYFCLTNEECNYIYHGAISHLIYFTTSGCQSTTGTIGNEKKDDDSIEFIKNKSSITNTEEELLEINQNKNNISQFEKFYNFLICRYTIVFVVFISLLVYIFVVFKFDFSEILNQNLAVIKEKWKNVNLVLQYFGDMNELGNQEIIY